MRWLAQIAFVLLGVSIANANTITAADTRAMLDINHAMIAAGKDIARAGQGMVQGHDFSANETCLENVRDHLLIVQAGVQSLVGLFLIASEMIDARDETAALHITNIAVDEFLDEAQTIREQNDLGQRTLFEISTAHR